MNVNKDFRYFGYFTKNLLEKNLKGEISAERFFEILKRELEEVKD
jgi:hypothetical protein